jgi:ubiquinone biosynthesis protein COQ4
LATLQDRDALRQLPEGSVGRAYLAFVETENLSADGLVMASQDRDREQVSADIAFYRDRMRDAHDLTHVLTGYGRDPLGENALLAFMYAHTRNLGMAFIVAMGWLKLSKAGRRAVAEAWRNGRKAAWLQNQHFEALLSRPLATVRRELGIVAPLHYCPTASR